MKKLGDKRQERLTVNRRIDIRVQCPNVMQIRLHLLSDRRFWVVTKFANSYSHDLSSPDKIHHFYSYQTYRSKMSRSIMTNLIDVGMHPSNVSHVVNVMNHGDDCEEVSSQQVTDYIRHKRNNIGEEFISVIKYFQEKVVRTRFLYL